jgi:serine/threonine protein kinase
VWACGILLSILLTGVPPCQQDGSSHLLIHSILDGELNFETQAWMEVSPNALALVRKLLETDENKRFSAVNALNDRWLLNLCKVKRNN